MSFPFLVAHQIYPHFLNLAGRLSPVSIRDQIVRAQALVDDAVAAGLISREPWRPLLVVGAGAAGASLPTPAHGRAGIRLRTEDGRPIAATVARHVTH